MNVAAIDTCGCILGIILLSLLPGGARAQTSGGQELFREPIGRFVFDASLGNPAPPVTVWYYRPDKVEPATRVVFLLHGSSRTAQEARDIGALYGKKHNFILLAPEFSEKNYPGDAYAFGNILGPNGKLLPTSVWAFATIERVFDRVRQELRLSTETYDILGHSAARSRERTKPFSHGEKRYIVLRLLVFILVAVIGWLMFLSPRLHMLIIPITAFLDFGGMFAMMLASKRIVRFFDAKHAA